MSGDSWTTMREKAARRTRTQSERRALRKPRPSNHKMLPPYTDAGAVISPDGVFRYVLWRTWDASKGAVVWLMLNPSTADHMKDDPTIQRCAHFSNRWGYGAMRVINLFALRSTDPLQIERSGFRYSRGPENDEHIVREAQEAAGPVVAAWGGYRTTRGRAEEVELLLAKNRVQLHCLRLTKGGSPSHPLYLPGELTPILYRDVP